MSSAIVRHVFDKTQHHGNAKVLLLALAYYANTCCGLAFPSVATLARRVGVNERNTHKLLKKVSTGLNPELEILVGQGPRGTNLYRFRGVSLATPCSERQGVAAQHQGCPWRRKRGVAPGTRNIMEQSERKKEERHSSLLTTAQDLSPPVPTRRLDYWLTPGSRIYTMLAGTEGGP